MIKGNESKDITRRPQDEKINACEIFPDAKMCVLTISSLQTLRLLKVHHATSCYCQVVYSFDSFMPGV